jgi:hypothetical protein
MGNGLTQMTRIIFIYLLVSHARVVSFVNRASLPDARTGMSGLLFSSLSLNKW